MTFLNGFFFQRRYGYLLCARWWLVFFSHTRNKWILPFHLHKRISTRRLISVFSVSYSTDKDLLWLYLLNVQNEYDNAKVSFQSNWSTYTCSIKYFWSCNSFLALFVMFPTFNAYITQSCSVELYDTRILWRSIL